MAPKKVPTPFEVDGVQCTLKDGLINAGLNDGMPRELQLLAKVKATATLVEAKAKVREHGKFAALATHVAQAAQPSSSSTPPPPLEASNVSSSLKIGARELESLRELNAAANGAAMVMQVVTTGVPTVSAAASAGSDEQPQTQSHHAAASVLHAVLASPGNRLRMDQMRWPRIASECASACSHMQGGGCALSCACCDMRHSGMLVPTCNKHSQNVLW